MILVDMIGDRNLTIQREQHVDDVAEGHHLGRGARSSATARSSSTRKRLIEDDHLPFLEAGVPSVDIIDLDYPQWHNESACCDDLTKVSARSLQIVGDVLLAALPDIEKRAGQIDRSHQVVRVARSAVPDFGLRQNSESPAFALAKMRSTRSSVASRPRRSSQ